MPNRDGTGPDSEGPRSGRGLGPCREADPIDEVEIDDGRPMTRRNNRPPWGWQGRNWDRRRIDDVE